MSLRDRSWSEQDRARLSRWWADRMPLVEIAESLDRPMSEVVTRLVRDGVLFYSQVSNAFHLVAPVITMAEIEKLDDERKQ